MVTVAIVELDNKREHVSTWSTLENVSVAAVVDPNGGASSAEERETVSSLHDLQTYQVDLLDVTGSAEEKEAYLAEAAKLGLNCFSEAPIAVTEAKTRELEHLFVINDASLYVGQVLDFAPEYVDAANQVKDGKLGSPGVMRLSSKSTHPQVQADIFAELGTSEFGWLVKTFGNVERVFAKHVKDNRNDGSIIEYVLATLRFADSTISHVELSWAAFQAERSFELTGDEGMLVYKSTESEPIQMALSSADKATKQITDVWQKSSLQQQLEQVLLHPKTTKKSWAVIHHAMQIADAARESAGTNKPVELEGGSDS